MSDYDNNEIVRVLNLEALPTPLSGVPSFLTQTYGVFIKDTNVEKNLILVHYHDSVEMSKVPATHGVRTVRGAILDVSSIPYKVACPTLAYVPTIVMDETFFEAIKNGNEECSCPDTDGVAQRISVLDGSIPDAHEGVMLRLWEHTGSDGKSELMVSSYKKINCLGSTWGNGENFGDMLAKFIDLSKVTFGSDRVPHFILLSTKHLMSFSDEKPAVHYVSGPGASMVPGALAETYHKGLTKDKLLELGAVIAYTEGANGTFLRSRLVNSNTARRLELVGNDPNVLHRCYMLLDEIAACGVPGLSTDTYLAKFPPVPVVHDKVANEGTIKTRADIQTHGKLFTPEQLTDKKDPNVFERRVRNALTHYAISISNHFTTEVVTCIGKLIEERKDLVRVLQDNFSKFKEGDFTGYACKDKGKGISGFYAKRLKNAEDFSKKSKVPIKKVILTCVMRDNGQNLYRMVDFLGLRKYEAEPVAEQSVKVTVDPNSYASKVRTLCKEVKTA